MRFKRLIGQRDIGSFFKKAKVDTPPPEEVPLEPVIEEPVVEPEPIIEVVPEPEIPEPEVSVPEKKSSRVATEV